jgi:endonuclease/exonuclease/phosphatase family metal-dependent hydrolase
MRLTGLVLIILWFSAVSCKKKETDYSARTSYYRNVNAGKTGDSIVTMLTYNIQLGFNGGQDPWDKDQEGGTPEHIDKLVQLIEQTGADIIALQEVPLDRSNIIVKKFLDTLAAHLDMNYAFAAHGYNDAYYADNPVKGQWGVAVLSKYFITEMDSREVSYIDVWTRRSTVRARLKLKENKEIDVYSLHHKPMQDYSDISKTAAFVHESTLPSIVAGDFNTAKYEPELILQMQCSLPDSLSGIDLIFCSSDFTPLTGYTDRNDRLSDHPPIWVKLKY